MPFWVLLAAALPLSLLSQAAYALGGIANLAAASNATFLPVVTLEGGLAGAIASLALVAYARYTPAVAQG